jgi:hypothetical protein
MKGVSKVYKPLDAKPYKVQMMIDLVAKEAEKLTICKCKINVFRKCCIYVLKFIHEKEIKEFEEKFKKAMEILGEAPSPLKGKEESKETSGNKAKLERKKEIQMEEKAKVGSNLLKIKKIEEKKGTSESEVSLQEKIQ